MIPRFIVIDGIDGAGKTTQSVLLRDALRERGVECVVHSEPTGSGYGVLLRRALRGSYQADAREMAELFTRDREVHSDGIRELLACGVSVVCDRYYYSTFAYQGTALSFDEIAELSFTDRILQPDICVFLDMDPGKGLERIGGRSGGREIFENIETLRTVREKFTAAFEYIASAPGRNENVVRVDALGTPDEVAARVLAEVEPLFGLCDEDENE